MDWEGTGIWHVALALGAVAWAWAILHILTTRYSAAGTSAWLLAIVLLPYVSVPLYALFGGRKLRRVMRRKAHIRLQHENEVDVSVTGEIDRLLRGLGLPGATCGNHLQMYSDGVSSWQALIDLIEDAERTIDLITYVIKDDPTGRGLIERLAAKSRQGVAVRLLYDSFGSFSTKRSLFDPLVEAGGKVCEFMPAGWWPFRSRTNLRNHRKLMVVDGKVAWAGGMNIADEYLGPTPRALSGEKRWLDISFTLEGPAVQAMAKLFRSDWAFASGADLADSEEPGPVAPVFYGDEGVVQIAPSGPDVDYDPLYATLITATFEARERLWIATPYYVPNEPLSEAICLAALRGIDVRIIVPKRSNHAIADLARGPYLRDLQRAGGKVYLLPMMMHAKLVVLDDRLAIHGSANVDARSLFLNFEVATICYSRSDVDAARRWLESLFAQALLRPLATTQLQRVKEGAMRLITPLL